MANLNLQTLTTTVQNFATAVQASATKLIDFSVGSVMLAVAEAVGGAALWLQGLIVQVLALTRASTSSGADLDSWFADFGFARLPAVAATVQETFSRFTPTNQALVQVGATVQSADGTLIYQVIADTTNAAYSASQNGYVVGTGVASVTCAVQCLTAGMAGNVSAGEISVLGSAIPGIDTCTNAAAAVNGVDAEQDAPARARFVLYINSLSKATLAAIMAAILAVQDGIIAKIIENQTYTGTAQNGLLTVIADDGTGSPPSSLLSNVATAVDTTRAAGVTFGVFGPTVETATVVMAITVSATGPAKSTIQPLVQAAVQKMINSLQAGQTLAYTSLIAAAYGASPYVTNVSGVTLNGGTSDLTATSTQVIKAGTITVN